MQISLPALSLLLFCCASLGGCGERALAEQELVGTYTADADWGKSTLILHPDHSFEQTVLRNDHTHVETRGTWQFTPDAKNASWGNIVFSSFLAVAHDEKGDLAGGAFLSAGRGLLWGVHIAADPDWGITFEKE